jgi:hypothetical protein
MFDKLLYRPDAVGTVADYGQGNEVPTQDFAEMAQWTPEDVVLSIENNPQMKERETTENRRDGTEDHREACRMPLRLSA